MRTFLLNFSVHICLLKFKCRLTPYLSIIALLLLVKTHAYPQNLLESRTSSYYTYVFKLTEKEARKIYKRDLWKVDSSYFHTLIDSVATDSASKLLLPKGHYLKAFTKENNLNLSIISIPEFDVKVVNNNTDLNIHVYDTGGQLITDAEVFLGSKRLRFDDKSKSFRDVKSNRQGMLKVYHDGFTAYFSIDREYNNSQFKRTSGKILYSIPVKYVWIPVRFVLFIPIDGVRSLVHWNSMGSIWHVGNFFKKSYHKIACLFDDYHCVDDYKFTNKHKGYFALNKPKYQPGDTVKFKAFIVNRNGKPVKDQVEVFLGHYGKETKLTDLTPYRPGAYEYQFPLHDSLQLLLDSRLQIELRKKEDKVFMTEYFNYEEYELSKVNLSVRLSDEKQFKGKVFAIFATGKDENELDLPDAYLEVLALAKDSYSFYESSLFIPDTLFFTHLKLAVRGETKIIIPDTMFPQADFSYDLMVRLKTSDNDVATERKKVAYFHKNKTIDYELAIDSIDLKFKINDVEMPANAEVFAQDHFGHRTRLPIENLPAKLKINPYYSGYVVKVDSIEQVISVVDEPPLIQCMSERTMDSLHIVINNPRKIDFTYFIYRKNTELTRGFGKALNYHKKTSSKQNFFVSVQYLWAGKVRDEHYKIPLKAKELNIRVNQPAVIYPGQKTEIEIEVTDKAGKPVKNVDLTAFGITGKFNAAPPEVPDLEKPLKNKEIINNFTLENQKTNGTNRYLDYTTWKVMAGLDSIEYYKFRYPEREMYCTSFFTEDSISQFAPFVFYNGIVEPVHVVYVNHIPKYFRWSSNPQPYSFRVDSGYHKVELRTDRNRIIIDSVYFPEKKKTIFSLDLSKDYPHTKIYDADPQLTDVEKRNLYKYIFPYQKIFGEKYAYIKQGDHVQLLTGTNSYNLNLLAGPVDGRGVSFKVIDGYKLWFQHEPMFEYEFEQGLLKMRQFNVKSRYPSSLSAIDHKIKLGELLLTEKKIMRQWQEHLEDKRFAKASYSNPYQSPEGTGTLTVKYQMSKSNPDRPLNILLFSYQDHDFIRVYPGSNSNFYALEKGLYKLIYFYPGSRYLVFDSLQIEANGLNYIRISESETKRKDEFSNKVNSLIEKTIFRPVSDDSYEIINELNSIKREHQQQFRFEGAGEIISGYVYENESHETLPGVNVIIKGTNIGTVTDIDGYYSLKVPASVHTLVFSSVGYLTEEVNLSGANHQDVVLQADVTALQEIIVVGYGMQRRSNLTASIQMVDNSSIPESLDFANQLQGRVAGITIQPSGGAIVSVRGVSVNFEGAPLYVIDGVIYTGDISKLKPEFIDDIEMLKDAKATAIYGARAAYGVVIITTKANTFEVVGQRIGPSPNSDLLLSAYGDEANSIRNNFSDYAYWQPRLTTNAEGKATFQASFPDDVTKWDTFVLAMNDKRQSGVQSDYVKSFKPLMAQLALPRFIVKGDTVQAIGKILNYTTDTLNLNSTFELEGECSFTEEKRCASSIIDTLSIYAQTEDSVKVKYFIETESGYVDGEQRSIPVYPLGMEQTKGSFYVLESDTTFDLTFNPQFGEVSMYAQSNILEVLEDEIHMVGAYKYDCNEQLASKLKVLLAQRTLYAYRGRKLEADKRIEEIINKLMKRKSRDGLWGWWQESGFNSWISLHVLEALLEARAQGYDVKLSEAQTFELLYWQLTRSNDATEKVRILQILKLLEFELDFGQLTSQIDAKQFNSLNNYLKFMELRAQIGLEVDMDTLRAYERETMMGNLYYSDSSTKNMLFSNEIQNTILVYKLLKYDSIHHQNKLSRIRNYFMEKRHQGHWSNTYESSKIIEVILPDLLGEEQKIQKSQLQISGALNSTIAEFPFEIKLKASDKITISKSGDYPVYFTAHQSYWNPDPEVRSEEFEVNSYFKNHNASLVLEAGKEIELIVDLKVNKDAEFVMIEVPIPASCSYESKEINRRLESHREHFREKVSIFCEFLKTGTYQYKIQLLPKYAGKYHLNPAKAELMYFPTFYGNTSVKNVVVE